MEHEKPENIALTLQTEYCNIYLNFFSNNCFTLHLVLNTLLSTVEKLPEYQDLLWNIPSFSEALKKFDYYAHD